MAKNKNFKKINLVITGIVNIEDEKIIIETEDNGSIDMLKALKSFDGKDVSISVTYQNQEIYD